MSVTVRSERDGQDTTGHDSIVESYLAQRPDFTSEFANSTNGPTVFKTLATSMVMKSSGLFELSCHRFRANEVHLQLSVLAYNLGNLWRRLVLPKRIDSWSLTSLRRLVKTGGRLVKHAWYYWLLLAESHLTRRLFGAMLQRIWGLPVPTG